METANWFFKVGDQVNGPVSYVELRWRAATGEIEPDTLVRRGDDVEWAPARRVKGLFNEPHVAKLPGRALPTFVQQVKGLLTKLVPKVRRGTGAKLASWWKGIHLRMFGGATGTKNSPSQGPRLSPDSSGSAPAKRPWTMSENRTVIAVLGIVAVACLIAFYIWASHNRYYIVTGSQGFAYEVDRKTGESWLLYRDHKTPQEGYHNAKE